jgi:hypothetical protein
MWVRPTGLQTCPISSAPRLHIRSQSMLGETTDCIAGGLESAIASYGLGLRYASGIEKASVSCGLIGESLS